MDLTSQLGKSRRQLGAVLHAVMQIPHVDLKALAEDEAFAYRREAAALLVVHQDLTKTPRPQPIYPARGLRMERGGA